MEPWNSSTSEIARLVWSVRYLPDLALLVGQPKMSECSSVGAKFVGRQQFRHEALLPEQLAY